MQTSIIICLILGAYLHQIFEIIKKKSSHGISFQAYILTTIATFSLLLNADNSNVFYIAAIELSVVLTTIFLILFYRSNDLWESYTNGIFLIAATGSFFMLHGITQTVKSFYEEDKSSVSSLAYGIWIFQDVLLLTITNSYMIRIAFALNIGMYSYIIWKNEKIKQKVVI